MTALTEPTNIQDIMIYETDPRYTRDEVTFRHSAGVNATFEIGQTLITSTGKRIPAASGDADAILLKRLVNIPTATDVLRVPILRKGPAIVNRDALTFESTVDGTEETAQMADLEALGIRYVVEPAKQTNG